MGTIREADQNQLEQANGSPEIARLSALVEKLQSECETLRQALATAESERALYLKAVYEHARTTLHFEDIDVDELKKTSTRLVEPIE